MNIAYHYEIFLKRWNYCEWQSKSLILNQSFQIWLKVQDSRFKIQKEKYKNAFQEKKLQILGNQRMRPQQSYYKAFISH